MQLDLNKNTELLDLTKVAPSLIEVRAELSWGMHPVSGAEFDLDLFGFVTTNGKLTSTSDVVFFNNKVLYGGAVNYPRDSRDGGDIEELTVKLGQVPSDKDAIEIFVFIHLGTERRQDFSMIANGVFKLFDEKGTLLQDYKLQQFVNGTALHIGSLSRNSTGWGFQPVGESAQANPNEVLSAFV